MSLGPLNVSPAPSIWSPSDLTSAPLFVVRVLHRFVKLVIVVTQLPFRTPTYTSHLSSLVPTSPSSPGRFSRKVADRFHDTLLWSWSIYGLAYWPWYRIADSYFIQNHSISLKIDLTTLMVSQLSWVETLAWTTLQELYLRKQSTVCLIVLISFFFRVSWKRVSSKFTIYIDETV